jgi:hypothetical protein
MSHKDAEKERKQVKNANRISISFQSYGNENEEEVCEYSSHMKQTSFLHIENAG